MSTSQFIFSDIDNSKFLSTIQGKNSAENGNLKLFPSFTVQTFLDKIPGSEEFLRDSINSKY